MPNLILCVTCLTPVENRRGGRHRRYCDECRRKHINARQRAKAKARTAKRRRRISPERCHNCGEEFTPVRPEIKFCCTWCYRHWKKTARMTSDFGAPRQVPCAGCGHPVTVWGSKRRKRCRWCIATTVREDFDYGHCERCGKELSGRRFSTRRFCSRQCRRSAGREHRCTWCGRKFLGPEDTRHTCSPLCELAWRSYRHTGGTFSKWSPMWPDVVRPTTDIDVMKSALDEVERLSRARFIPKRCGCGEWFVWDMRVGGVPAEFCGDACQARASRERRRARKRNAYVADVDRAYIFERDRYRCQICHGRLAMKQKVPHPKSPTIDHIIPLAAGGTHEPSNAQAAHFICNSMKSAGQSNDQLLLVG